MIKVTFVCLGNICRSPMAELIFKDIVTKQGYSNKFEITSCATSRYEIGSPIYPPAQQTLSRHGINGSHIARQINSSDLTSDYILVMDSSNLRDVMKLKDINQSKVFKLCDFSTTPRDVADPWYTRNFELAYNDIYDGCTSFLNYLIINKIL